MSELIDVYIDKVFNPEKSGTAVTTIGTFDGVHLGHQKILERLSAKESADRIKTVVTFKPHPQTVMRHRPGEMPTISNPDEKLKILKESGVDRVFIIHFTEKLAQLSAEKFLTEILLKRLKSSRLVVGYNHSFGQGREGNAEFLEKVKGKYGFELEVVKPYYVQGEAISSTKIRKALGAGDIGKARTYLGRPYLLIGKVVPGRGVGRKIQFPTANLELIHQGKLIPKIGVYSVAVGVDDHIYAGMLNIGTRPTFGEGAITIEVHLIDFDGDLYGKTINLLFLARLRKEQRFESSMELSEQIKKDRVESLKVFEAETQQDFHQELFKTI